MDSSSARPLWDLQQNNHGTNAHARQRQGQARSEANQNDEYAAPEVGRGKVRPRALEMEVMKVITEPP